jgi:hypothetical protein
MPAGAGALASPLVATQFAQLPRWSFHYLVSLVIASSNTAFLIAIFRFKNQEGAASCYLSPHPQPISTLTECLTQIGQAAGEPGTSENGKMRQILSLKAVHLLAIFILVYVGVEVTIAGQWPGLRFGFAII